MKGPTWIKHGRGRTGDSQSPQDGAVVSERHSATHTSSSSPCIITSLLPLLEAAITLSPKPLRPSHQYTSHGYGSEPFGRPRAVWSDASRIRGGWISARYDFFIIILTNVYLNTIAFNICIYCIRMFSPSRVVKKSPAILVQTFFFYTNQLQFVILTVKLFLIISNQGYRL